MTLRQLYQNLLIEMNKIQAAPMLLEDFNYFVNKSVQQYINKKYNVYEINQQSSDDLRVLQTTATLNVTDSNSPNYQYEVFLPHDYLHLLNCICNFKAMKSHKCIQSGDEFQYKATRLTADLWGQIINNYYMRPTYERPYFYLNNVNINQDVPTNPPTYDQFGNNTNPQSTDMNDRPYDSQNNSNFPRTFTLGQTQVSLIDKPVAHRISNPTRVRLEIRCGKNPDFKLQSVYIDYLKSPQLLNLTQEQLDLIEDTSQIMEFPDYVCNEIINELTHLIMENSSDQRLQTHIPISTSIAPPAQTVEKK